MKWGATKQARQRLKRLEAKGIKTDAGAAYRAAEQAIRSNKNMSRAEKSKAMEAAAKSYMRSGMSTAGDIKKKAERLGKQGKYVQDYLEQLEKDGGLRAVADYVDASKKQRDVMLNKHYNYNAVSAVAEVVKNSDQLGPDDFYKMNHDIAVRSSKKEMSPDEVQALITELEEKYRKAFK